MTSHRQLWGGLIAALVLTLAACGSSGGQASGDHAGGHGAAPSAAGQGHDEPAPPPVAGAPETAVTASAFKFEPAELALRPGQPVNIRLTATDMLHDFTVEGLDFHLASDTGQTTTGGLAIEAPGTYLAYCTVPGHREAGMEATITVE